MSTHVYDQYSHVQTDVFVRICMHTLLFLHRLKRLVTVIMDQYRIDHLSGAFLFGVDESMTSMMDRAHSKGVI